MPIEDIIALAADPLTRIVNVQWGGNFVFGGSSGPGNGTTRLQSSSDGSIWQRVTSVESIGSGTDGHFGGALSIAYGDGCWLMRATSDGVVYRSSDGMNWSAVLIAGGSVKIVFAKPENASESKFYVTGFDGSGNSVVWSSADGLDWSAEIIGNSDNQPYALAFTGGALYASTARQVADDWATHFENTLFRSLDGVTWQSLGEIGGGLKWDTQVFSFGLVPADRRIVDIVKGNDVTVALLIANIQNNNTSRRNALWVSVSTDGLSFSAPQMLGMVPGGASTIVYSDRFIVGGGKSSPLATAGTLATSEDGVAWTYYDPLPSASFGPLAANGGKVVAIASLAGDDFLFKARSFIGKKDQHDVFGWTETVNSFNVDGTDNSVSFAAKISKLPI